MMKNNVKNIFTKFLLITILFSIFSTQVFSIESGNIDYIQPQNAVVSFGSNIWHDNFSKGTAIFPLIKAWENNIGIADGQPIIIENLVFILSDKNINILDKITGKVLNRYNIQSIYPEYTTGNLFVLKNSNNIYNLIIPTKDGLIINLRVTNENGNIIFERTWDWNINKMENEKIKTSKITTNDITILKDKNLNRIYVGFGTYSGQLVVIDVETGKTLTNGNVEIIGSLGSGSGIPYKDFSTIVFVQNNSRESGLIGGSVLNGVFSIDKTLTRDIHVEGLIAPIAFSVIENPIYNSTSEMLVMQDKKGTIIAYDLTNKEILFKIDEFSGNKSINSFSISGRYLLITLSKNERLDGKIIAVDYKKAIQIAQSRLDLKGNGAIIFEENLDKENYNAGALSLSIVEQKQDDYGNIQETINREVFLIGSRGKKKNLGMYYLDQFNIQAKKPIPVPYAFKISNQEGVYTTVDSLEIDGGVVTPISYASGYLIFGDGKGNLQAYTALKENNLALTNFDNSEGKLSVGNTYIAKVDVINYSGKLQRNIPVEFYINDLLVHNSLIEIPEDGLTVNFQYTVPADYEGEKIKIEAKLNMKAPRNLEETTYKDNEMKLELDVDRRIDIVVKDLKNANPVFANTSQKAMVRIINDSNVQLNNILIWYRMSGRTIGSERINLEPGENIIKNFSWKAPNSNTEVVLSVVADPYREVADVDRNNNTATYKVKINKSTDNSSSSCINNKSTGRFSMPYTWLERIETHFYTDKNGKVHYWQEEIWESKEINYIEELDMIVSVNTNQQSESSRGGWDIIPYARKNNLNANKVTRSGYGIELKVTVNYSTSPGWELLPSQKATPYGPDYLNRVKNVAVYANLPNGERIKMVRTIDSENTAVFELPEVVYKPSGINETWRGRFFSMPPRTPDGGYPFTIEVEGGGETGLGCTLKEEIYIYGDVFKDTNIKRNN